MCKECCRKRRYHKISVIILQHRKVIFKLSSTTQWRDMTNKAWKILKRKRRRTCRHGARRIWKLSSKGRPAGKLTWWEPSSDNLDYRWRDNIQRSSPQNTGRSRAKTVTTLRLKNCAFRHPGSSSILYLTTYKMSDNIKEDILVTYISVIQC